MSARAISPVLGTVLLVLATVVVAGAVGVVALGTTVPASPQTVAIDVRIDAGAERLTFVHRGGDPLDVRELSIHVEIGGTPLAAQPPVPFFAADGFRSGPTGPFNSASDPRWTAGETASVRLAGTNDPSLSPGARVVVKIYSGDATVTETSATA